MSKWEKLLARICALSKDLRFDELRKVLESYGYKMEAVIIHSVNPAVSRSPYQSMNRSKEPM